MIEIGDIISKLKSCGEDTFANELETIISAGSKVVPSPKDVEKIKAIKEKTKRDYETAKKLATMLAAEIKTSGAAARLAKASLKVYSGKIANRIHDIFWKRYQWLKQVEKYGIGE